MSEWTPGPWVVDGPFLASYIPDKQGRDVIQHTVTRGNGQPEIFVNGKDPLDSAHDAHLIAAAPDLYEALMVAYDSIGCIDCLYEYCESCKKIAVKVEYALAKARGEA